MLTPLTIEVAQDGGGHPVLLVSGEIDLSNVETFRQAVATAILAGRVRVDLRAVEYLDSAAINALCHHAEHIHVTASPLLKSALILSGLSELTTVDIVPAP